MGDCLLNNVFRVFVFYCMLKHINPFNYQKSGFVYHLSRFFDPVFPPKAPEMQWDR
jgi:hypothetical protein